MPEPLFRDIAPRGNDLAGLALPGRQPLDGDRAAEPAFVRTLRRHDRAGVRAGRGQLRRSIICRWRCVRRCAAMVRGSQDPSYRITSFAPMPGSRAICMMPSCPLKMWPISVGLSPGHLQQLFRSATGLTVADAIRDRRLANCRKALADPSLGDQSITEIAFRWGFSESSSSSGPSAAPLASARGNFAKSVAPASHACRDHAARAGGPAASSSANSPSVKTRLRVRKRTPSGASAEKPEPRPGTTSMMSWVCCQYSNCAAPI